jgi:hypothetical protein
MPETCLLLVNVALRTQVLPGVCQRHAINKYIHINLFAWVNTWNAPGVVLPNSNTARKEATNKVSAARSCCAPHARKSGLTFEYASRLRKYEGVGIK